MLKRWRPRQQLKGGCRQRILVGPAVDLKLMAMQAGSFGRGFVVRFAPLTFVVAIVCASVVGGFLIGAR